MPSASRHRRSNGLTPMDRARLIAHRPIRQHLTFGEKLEVINFYHEHKTFLTVEAMVKPLRDQGFSTICRTTIRRCVRDEAQIRQYVAGDMNRLHAKHETVVCHPQVEQALVEWIHHKLNNHIRLRGDVLMEKARELCDVLGIPPEERIGFTRGWLDRFKQRHGLHRVTFSGERASVPFEQVIAERVRLQPILAQYALWDTYNVDETAIYGSQPPTSGLGTWDTGGLKSNKSRMTVALGTNGDGSDKLIPLFIGHAAHPRCFPRNCPPRKAGYYYFHNENAWMKFEVWNQFLTDLNEAMRQVNRHILLLCDNASSHKSKIPTMYSNVRVEYLSPNLTPWVQPMDAGVTSAKWYITQQVL